MSYTPREAKNERALDLSLARTPGELTTLANQLMKEGDEELAQALKNKADREDYDDGKEEREAYQAETNYAPAEGY